MARPKQTKGFNYKQLRRLLKEVDPKKLWQYIDERVGDSSATLDGNRIRLRCFHPDHDDRTPSAFITVGQDAGYARCFGCGYTTTSLVDIVSLIDETDTLTALQTIRRVFGMNALTPAARKGYEEWQLNQKIKSTIYHICHDYMVEQISTPTEQTAQQAIQYLDSRGLKRDTLHALPIGIVPPMQYLVGMAHAMDQAQGLTEDQGIAKPLNDYVSGRIGVERLGAILFPNYLGPDTYGRFRTRQPDTPSSAVRPIDDDYDTDVGFFGLGWDAYNDYVKDSRDQAAYVVEGEFDALLAMQAMLEGGARAVIISGGGAAGGTNLDHLHQAGLTTAHLVTDNPTHGGDKVLQQWVAKAEQIKCRIFVGWDPAFSTLKDPDEVVKILGYDKFHSAITAADNYISAHAWMVEQALPELQKIDPDDIRELVEVAADYGSSLVNPVERHAYVEAIVKEFGLPPALLQREIVAGAEDELGFILRVAKALQERFHIVGHRRSGQDGRALELWDPEKDLAIHVPLARPSAIEEKLSLSLGPAMLWVNTKVGAPSFIAPPDVNNINYLRVKKDYIAYIQEALNILAEDAPDIEGSDTHSQGLHRINNNLYVVNGRDIFRWTMSENPEEPWTKLKGPSDNGTLFSVAAYEKKWLPHVHTVDDLKACSKDEIMSWYKEVQNMFSIAWRFKHHALETQYLAALVLASQLVGAFPRGASHMFVANTTSGKSNCLSVFGGLAVPELCLVSNSLGMDSYSRASVRAAVKDKTHTICLDEFESDDTSKMYEVSKILEMFRNVIGEDPRTSYGTRDGGKVDSKLKVWPFYAGIAPPRLQQDVNRINFIRMNTRPNTHGTPLEIVRKEIGLARIAELREKMSTGLFAHMPEILTHYQELSAHYGTAGNLPHGASDRFFILIYPALSIMRFLGIDAHQFATDYAKAKKDRLQLASQISDSDEIFYAILRSQAMEYEDAATGRWRPSNPSRMLANPELREEINLSECGVFYEDKHHLLVVVWETAIQGGIMRHHPKWKRETGAHVIHEIAGRSRRALSAEEIRECGVHEFLRSVGQLGTRNSRITAYRVEDLIKEAAQRGEEEVTEDILKYLEDDDNENFG